MKWSERVLCSLCRRGRLCRAQVRDGMCEPQADVGKFAHVSVRHQAIFLCDVCTCVLCEEGKGSVTGACFKVVAKLSFSD